MTELLVVLVAGFLVIAASTVLGPRLGIASPLVLVAIGVGASFLPVFADLSIEPEWILQGLLPPLLYSSAVSMPAMNFRREFGAISGLSVVLVVASSLVLGLFFMWVIPDLGFGWGVALGAIISPTDAVATSIVKQAPVSKRVVVMLDGESLLNDATALVLLRTAIVASAAAFSFWGTLGTFAYSVVVAVAIGLGVGWLNLAVRKRITDPTANTVISFAVPFVAFVPAELFHASGLVAAVVAGLVTGIRAPRDLSPQNRLSDASKWRTIELVLEGVVFLTMGLQIKEVVSNVEQEHGGVALALLIAFGALFLTVLVRSLYVAPLLVVLRGRARQGEAMRVKLTDMQEKAVTPEGKRENYESMSVRGGHKGTERDFERCSRRITRVLADIDYFRRGRLGWGDGVAVVWAGMRGAVTVAAAQTLPEDAPQRSMLIFIAFAVALLSLAIQGGSIGTVLRRLKPSSDQAVLDAQANDERQRIMQLMRDSAATVPAVDLESAEPSPALFDAAKKRELAALRAQRTALLDARANGSFDADVLENALANLDASEIAIEMRGKPVD